MPSIYRVLGQSAPSAATDTTLYTVPIGTSAVVSTLNICNRAATTGSFRVAVRPAGAALANQHYIAFDTPIPANDSITITAGISLAATDVITVYGSASLSFVAFGAEIT